ncbi:MAG: hypothetical protein M0Z84_04510 [Gammaproteobacteria bacterium]|nr:hypothetical protein [Gammaproteobacteria bacterium]
MEWEIYVFVIFPAIVALVLKTGLFGYAYVSRTRNAQTRIYMALLVLLFIQNVALIPGYIAIAAGHTPYPEATLFYLSEILAVAVLLHLAASLAFERGSSAVRLAAIMAYPAALVLSTLLLCSSLLIRGYAFHHYVVTRVPGPLYFLLESYAIAVVGGAVGVLLYGAYRQPNPQGRLRNSILLLAILPMAAVIVLVIILLHFGATWINVSALQPLLTTYFLVVTGYATHQHRLFDVQFYIPWSRERKRKTAFYRRIRELVAEIADLASSGEILDRLAATLNCPVALVGSQQPLLAAVGGSRHMAEIPKQVLHGIDHIVVANEIADSCPESYRSLRRHGIAAVVPFHPHSQHAAGWLLLGGSFSDQVYTRLDFKVVEQLFDKMADLFLDKLLALRTQLADASRTIVELEGRQQELQAGLDSLRRHNERLQQQNVRLQQGRPPNYLAASTASALEAFSSSGPLAAAITLLGRDKPLLGNLRLHFPQIEHYVGIHSVGFQRQPAPDVVVVRIDDPAVKSVAGVAEFLDRYRGQVAMIAYGPGAAAFVAGHRTALRGGLVEVLSAAPSPEIAARAIRRLAALRQATFSIHDPDQPLIGRSEAFGSQMAAVARLAGFDESLLLRTTDVDQAAALAMHVHVVSGRPGSLHAVRSTAAADPVADLAAHAAAARAGTLLIPCFCQLPVEIRTRCWAALADNPGARVITVCDVMTRSNPASGDEGFKSFFIDMPDLQQRRDDLALLVHYFTMQFNIQSGARLSLTPAETEELCAISRPQTVTALKRAVFHVLSTRLPAAESGLEVDAIEVPEQSGTLDDYVAAFEARIIAQTLERCGGNKSKTARALGLRPNTLHYKLERYGISSSRSD